MVDRFSTNLIQSLLCLASKRIVLAPCPQASFTISHTHACHVTQDPLTLRDCSSHFHIEKMLYTPHHAKGQLCLSSGQGSLLEGAVRVCPAWIISISLTDRPTMSQRRKRRSTHDAVLTKAFKAARSVLECSERRATACSLASSTQHNTHWRQCFKTN